MSSVDEVKARLDIVDVIGSYVRLQKAGRQFKAVCPFHQEKTPSFIVSPDRQTWHCFGACGTGGDMFSFIERKENVDFNGALRILADRAGVELQREGARRDELQPLYDANEAAAIFYHSQLLGSSGPALAYAESRGMDRQAMTAFQVGFSPASWDTLRDHLGGRGFSDERLVEAGLLVASERGGRPYDRFRGRLMFPIRDDRGRVIGFGGRVLPDTPADLGPPPLDGGVRGGGAKYINTPQTPIFDKGGVLYALDRAREAIRNAGTAVIVEGYMDVVAAHQFGFHNVVASMGTALTERQVALAERFAARVVLAMDADEAGNAASTRDLLLALSSAHRRPNLVDRNRRVLFEQGMEKEWAVAKIPKDHDPDELIRSDPAAWAAVVESSKPILDHYYDVCREGRDLMNPGHRQSVIDGMLPVIAELPGSQQVIWVQRIAFGSRAAEDEIWREIRRRRRPTNVRREGQLPQAEAEALPAGSVQAQPRRMPREEFCLALLHKYPELLSKAPPLREESFILAENRELFRRFVAGQEVSEGEAVLWEHYERVISARLPLNETGAIEEAFLDCVARLEQARMKAVKEASALALAEGEASLSSEGRPGDRAGQVVAIARAKWEAGTDEEASDERPDEFLASQLLQDMEAGLRFHRRSIDSSRGIQGERPAE